MINSVMGSNYREERKAAVCVCMCVRAWVDCPHACMTAGVTNDVKSRGIYDLSLNRQMCIFTVMIYEYMISKEKMQDYFNGR